MNNGKFFATEILQTPDSMSLKRRAGASEHQGNNSTPTGKKLRSAECPSASQRRTRSSSDTPPVFVGEEDLNETMGTDNATQGRRPKPSSAEDIKNLLKEGLTNVAKKDQIDQMVMHIRTNSQALMSLVEKMVTTNELNDKRFKPIEE